MIPVHYLVRAPADVPHEAPWLTQAEADRFDRLTVPKRRQDWSLGRWTAKCALLALERGLPPESFAGAPGLAPRGPQDVEIRAAPDGAPEAFVHGVPAPWSLSLSHRAGLAACALAPAGTLLGCDLEQIEPHSEAFIEDYFAGPEQSLLRKLSAQRRPLLASLLWSAKESAFKALRTGLRSAPGQAVVRLRPGPPQDGWRNLLVELPDARIFHGWWRRDGDVLLTVVAEPQPAAPRVLDPAWGGSCDVAPGRLQIPDSIGVGRTER